jgi:hypothetical protein
MFKMVSTGLFAHGASDPLPRGKLARSSSRINSSVILATSFQICSALCPHSQFHQVLCQDREVIPQTPFGKHMADCFLFCSPAIITSLTMVTEIVTWHGVSLFQPLAIRLSSLLLGSNDLLSAKRRVEGDESRGFTPTYILTLIGLITFMSTVFFEVTDIPTLSAYKYCHPVLWPSIYDERVPAVTSHSLPGDLASALYLLVSGLG